MTTVVLVIHLMVAAALVALVLLQRSEGGALGIGGGGGGGGGGFMTGRGTADMLTRATAIAAAIFFATSLTLAILAKKDNAPTSIFDNVKSGTGPATPAGSAGDLDEKPTPGGLLKDLSVPKRPVVPPSR